MSPDEVVAEARAGRLRPVYLLVGDEQLWIDQVLMGLKAATLAGGMAGLNEDQLSAGEVDADSALAAARTLPMMAPRRWVLLRNLERWDTESKKANLDRIAEYAENPASSTVLVLLGPKLDKRRRLVNLARKQGWLVQCDSPKRQDLPRWLQGRTRERGNTISPAVAELLSELSGPELGPLADALERVCLYVGEGNEITEEAVSECVVRVRSTTVWQLVGAVGSRNVAGALRALDDVFDPQDRGLRLVGVLGWATRQLLKFESALRKGASPQGAAQAAGAPPFKARELAEQVRRVPRVALETWLERLAELDLALKGGSRLPPRTLLEQALIDLCHAPGGSSNAAPKSA